ncbi:MAG TPA: hypothetical protein VGA20_03800 [Gemmatimonadales bacterium]
MNPGRLALGILLAGATAPGLRAQEPPGFDQVPKIRGASVDTAAEASRLAALGSGARVRTWRVPASIEQMFKMYMRSLDATGGRPPDSVRPSELGGTPVTYYIVYHKFEDECADPETGGSTSDTGASVCQRWRRGKDKAKTLGRSRASHSAGSYIETATFTWFRREQSGELVRLRVELRDLGLSHEWKRHTPLAQLTIESVPVPP